MHYMGMTDKSDKPGCWQAWVLFIMLPESPIIRQCRLEKVGIDVRYPARLYKRAAFLLIFQTAGSATTG